MKVNKVSAFSYNNQGGNPAGVVLCDEMPSVSEMLSIAKEVGYSETAFAHPHDDGWRVRYFSPEIEVPFCGHATIATGYVLGKNQGVGRYKLYLNESDIAVSVKAMEDSALYVSLNSPLTFSEPAPKVYTDKILAAFHLSFDDVDTDFPIRFASAGAKHVIIVLNKRQTLSDMDYDFDAVKELMSEEDIVTINLLWKASSACFHSRNAFAAGGVYEDPATGAAAAAFAGYLRDIQWSGSSSFEVLQGEDMGSPSRLLVEYLPEVGSSIQVSGEASYLVD